jgi:hypothetical protein
MTELEAALRNEWNGSLDRAVEFLANLANVDCDSVAKTQLVYMLRRDPHNPKDLKELARQLLRIEEKEVKI